MNISNITALERNPDGDWDSPNGYLYSFTIAFEDETSGTCQAKSETPPYGVGDEVGYEEKGEYQGVPKLKITKDPHNAPRGNSRQNGNGNSNGRSGPPPRGSPGRAPAPTSGGIQGQTIGMALKEALCLVFGEKPEPSALNLPASWEQVHKTASDIVRLSQMMEKGQLAPWVKTRAGGAPVHRQAPPPPPPPAAKRTAEEIDEDVPF